MGVRVGVDVGGTFTKAVAIDVLTGAIVGRAVVPTTHTAAEGVAAGVVRCVAEVAAAVGTANVELVTHSTTQAVNALLEGDVGTVGVIGLGRRPEVKRARERTNLRNVELAPGKYLRTIPCFFDVSDGLDDAAVQAQLDELIRVGVSAVCVAEAFSPDDDRNETRVVALAAQAGLPACASSELTGLYGLELRTVTAAINASILPIALRTAAFVERGVQEAGIAAPVMVMRGDGGATDLAGFRDAPARTLYSGPAASVAGALRHTKITEGIVVEVGGTSTNIAAIRLGRPALSYVTVASHATALRSVDVRVVGVAGGSMLRVRAPKRPGTRGSVYAVGPRSAHIAGFAYACFASPDELCDAEVRLTATGAEDAADHLVLRAPSGTTYALTNTCAANALGITQTGDYAWAPPDAAGVAFELAGKWLGMPGSDVAAHMLQASGEEVCERIDELLRAQKIADPVIVAVGGGAGGLARHVAAMLGLLCVVPDDAEVISSIGDALSLVRVERERTVTQMNGVVAAALLAEVEREAVAAGASPASLEVRLEEQPEKGTVRAIATGAVGLVSGAAIGRQPATAEQIRVAAPDAELRATGAYWIARRGEHIEVLDRFGDRTAELRGEVVADLATLAAAVTRQTRHRGPVMLRPSVWMLQGTRLVELSSGDVVASALELLEAAPDSAVLVGRSV